MEIPIKKKKTKEEKEQSKMRKMLKEQLKQVKINHLKFLENQYIPYVNPDYSQNVYTKDEEEAIFSYIQSTPPEINMFLRNEIELDGKSEEFKTLVMAFNKSSTPEYLTLYRGISTEFAQDVLDGKTDVIIQDFLVSTTDEIINALHFSSDDNKVVLKIHVSSDTPSIDIGDLDISYRRFYLETEGTEIIFPPSRLDVISITNEYKLEGYDSDINCTEIYDYTRPYKMIECRMALLESIEDTLSRIC